MHVNLTEAGRERAERQRESMREAICWIFSQMGERRAREFVELTEEFTTYMVAVHARQTAPHGGTRSKPRSQETHRKTRSILRCK